MSDSLQNFFTFASLGTFAGASAAVIVVSNTIRKLFKLDSPWPAFVTSVLVTVVGAYSAHSLNNLLDAVLIIFNACLLFSSAAGMQETVVSVVQQGPAGGTKLQDVRRFKWLSSWFA